MPPKTATTGKAIKKPRAKKATGDNALFNGRTVGEWNRIEAEITKQFNKVPRPSLETALADARKKLNLNGRELSKEVFKVRWDNLHNGNTIRPVRDNPFAKTVVPVEFVSDTPFDYLLKKLTQSESDKEDFDC